MSEHRDSHDEPTPAVSDVWQNPQEADAESVAPNSDESGVLSYRNPKKTPSVRSLPAARFTARSAAVPAIVGLSILGAYWMTAFDPLVSVGLIWLGIGGLATAVIGLISLVYTIAGTFERPADPTIRYYGVALFLCCINVMAAVICVKIGGDLVDTPHPRLAFTNNTSVTISNVVAHFDSGDERSGALAPGQTWTSGIRWIKHHGDLNVTVNVGGLQRTVIDRRGLHPHGPLLVKTFTIAIEPNELPMAARQISP